MPELAGKSLITELRTYTNQYMGDEDDYYVFELPFAHPGHEHFQGCSGAPIVDAKGFECRKGQSVVSQFA